MANKFFDKSLPSAVDAEKLILGSVLLDGTRYPDVSQSLSLESFTSEAHRRIWATFGILFERGMGVDRITVAQSLADQSYLQSVGGLSYLSCLDEGLPRVSNLDSYVRIVVEKERLRKLITVAERIASQSTSGEFSADEILTNTETMLSDQSSGFGSNNLETVESFIRNAPGGLNRVLDPQSWDRGIPTGFAKLDEWTDGFHAGEIFVVGARPGHGKTSLAATIAKNVARRGKGVAFFSMELSKQMLFGRMVCDEAYLSYSRWRSGNINDEERARLRIATQTLLELPLTISDASDLTVADMASEVRRIERVQPVDLVVADYAQLFKPRGKRYSTENEKFTEIGEDVKKSCKKTGKPILLLSQLNRDSEKTQGDNRPKLAQARGAGVWEEIAYVGGCLYREWLRKREREDLRTVAELLLEKNRSGEAGVVQLGFIPWLMRFTNPQEREEQGS
jgi:replicative DNA helicase